MVSQLNYAQLTELKSISDNKILVHIETIEISRG